MTRQDLYWRPLSGPAGFGQQTVEAGQVLPPLHQGHPELLRADRVTDVEQELGGLHGQWRVGRHMEGAAPATTAALRLLGCLQAGVGRHGIFATIKDLELKLVPPTATLTQLGREKNIRNPSFSWANRFN